MKKYIFIILIYLFGFVSAYLFFTIFPKKTQAPAFINQIKSKPLEKYSIENLSKTQITPAEIKIDRILNKSDGFSSHLFFISFDPTLTGKDLKKVSGLINLPDSSGKFPVIVLLRGYVDQELYKTGDGSRRVGEFFAKNGFITIAPDFLGYGSSDKESENIFESRFQTWTTTLTLLKSIRSIPAWDNKNIFIWGHSNGGQIALTALEISQLAYPTVLWAPVSKPFPYSILYYTDESEDLGKFIRGSLSDFEENYDTNQFSIHGYLDRIKAPLDLHQGTLDDAVPKKWSDDLNEKLEILGLNITYHVYPGGDHNLNPMWDIVAGSSLEFFNKYLTNND